MVALHGQHNSFYADVEALTRDGWTNNERAAGRAEHRGVLHRDGMTIGYLTQGAEALFCGGSDTHAQIGLMAHYPVAGGPS